MNNQRQVKRIDYILWTLGALITARWFYAGRFTRLKRLAHGEESKPAWP